MTYINLPASGLPLVISGMVWISAGCTADPAEDKIFINSFSKIINV